ncbi:MAG: rhomboid family intramembrane serine protease, partial [Mycobacterium sp.]
NISWQGHLGGRVTGAALAAAYAYAPRKNRTAIQIAATVGLLLLFMLLIWWRTANLLAMAGLA